MRYSIRTVGPIAPAEAIPAVFSVAEAKLHLRVEAAFVDDDALIESYVAAAQDHVERHTSQVLTPRTLELALPAFPPAFAGAGAASGVGPVSSFIELPRHPVTAVTAIAYTDADGVAAELDEADWRWSESEPGLVFPAIGTSWPSAYDERGSVRVAFEAGYDEGLAPASLVAAVKLMVGHLYEHRGALGDDLPPGVASLCAPYRRVSL